MSGILIMILGFIIFKKRDIENQQKIQYLSRLNNMNNANNSYNYQGNYYPRNETVKNVNIHNYIYTSQKRVSEESVDEFTNIQNKDKNLNYEYKRKKREFSFGNNYTEIETFGTPSFNRQGMSNNEGRNSNYTDERPKRPHDSGIKEYERNPKICQTNRVIRLSSYIRPSI